MVPAKNLSRPAEEGPGHELSCQLYWTSCSEDQKQLDLSLRGETKGNPSWDVDWGNSSRLRRRQSGQRPVLFPLCIHTGWDHTAHLPGWVIRCVPMLDIIQGLLRKLLERLPGLPTRVGLIVIGDAFSIAPLLQKPWKSGSPQLDCPMACSPCLVHITNMVVRSVCTQGTGNRNSPGMVTLGPCATPSDPGFLREPFSPPCPPQQHGVGYRLLVPQASACIVGFSAF